jgi:hypothetical protein
MTEELTSPARVLVHAVEAPAERDRRSDRTAEDLAESAGERALRVINGPRRAPSDQSVWPHKDGAVVSDLAIAEPRAPGSMMRTEIASRSRTSSLQGASCSSPARTVTPGALRRGRSPTNRTSRSRRCGSAISTEIPTTRAVRQRGARTRRRLVDADVVGQLRRGTVVGDNRGRFVGVAVLDVELTPHGHHHHQNCRLRRVDPANQHVRIRRAQREVRRDVQDRRLRDHAEPLVLHADQAMHEAPAVRAD